MSHSLVGTYDPVLVAISVVVAVLASYVALDLTARVSAARKQSRKDWQPWLWVGLGAVAQGFGVWAMHFVGMLALKLEVPVRYDGVALMGSVAPAIAAAALALTLASRSHVSRLGVLAGAASMAAGIGTMHYLGMGAILSPSGVYYHSGLWWASMVIAVGASFGSLSLAFALRQQEHLWLPRRALAALVMGCAIAGMHYAGMAAARFPAAQVAAIDPSAPGVLATRGLAGAVTAAACLLLGLSLLGAVGSVRLRETDERRRREVDQLLRTQEEWRRLRTEDMLRRSAVALAATGTAFYHAALGELMRMVGANVGMIAAIDGERAETVVLIRSGVTVPNTAFGLRGTVCGHVLERSTVYCVPEKLGAGYAHPWLEVPGEGYLGAPVYCPSGTRIGLIALFTPQPLPERGDVEAMLQIFVTRVAGEMKQQQTDAALRASERRLFDMEKMDAVGKLAGGVAHDFNNMLTVIIGYSCELAAEVESARALTRVHEILKAAERSRRLTQQLLAFGRRQVLQMRPIVLGTVVASLHDILYRVIREDITLIVRAGDGGAMIHADPVQLEQVILNLVVNARDAMPLGGSDTVATERMTVVNGRDRRRFREVKVPDGRYVMLSVTDTGSGMDEQTSARVFEPFFSTKGEHGTGLGLSTVHGIVQQSGATIQCATKVGEGSVFSIYFPQVDAALPAEFVPAPVVDGRGSECILVVEDEEPVRTFVRAALTCRGYKVLEADSAGEAMQVLDRATPHLILADMVIPGGMSGRDLATVARLRDPRVRTLLMSGYSSDPVDASQPFIQKPFTPQQLGAMVRDLLGREQVPA